MMETRLFFFLLSVPSVVVGFASGNWNRKHNSFFTPDTSAHKHNGMRRGNARNIKVSFSVASSSSANDSSGEFTYLTNSNYNSLIHSSKPVLIDCCAQWCGPCKLIEPLLKKASQKYSDQIEGIVKYDVESQNMDVKLDLLMRDVHPKKLPSLILFCNGEVMANHIGSIQEDELDELFQQCLTQIRKEEKKKAQKKREVDREKTAGRISFGIGKDDYML